MKHEEEKRIRQSQTKVMIGDLLTLYADLEISEEQLFKVLKKIVPHLKENNTLPF